MAPGVLHQRHRQRLIVPKIICIHYSERDRQYFVRLDDGRELILPGDLVRASHTIRGRLDGLLLGGMPGVFVGRELSLPMSLPEAKPVLCGSCGAPLQRGDVHCTYCLSLALC